MDNRIVCAANRWEDGRIICGARHWDKRMHQVAKMLRDAGAPLPVKHEQGFIDRMGDWHNRKDAWKIAEAAGQIIREVSGAGTLYSENLY